MRRLPSDGWQSVFMVIFLFIALLMMVMCINGCSLCSCATESGAEAQCGEEAVKAQCEAKGSEVELGTPKPGGEG